MYEYHLLGEYCSQEVVILVKGVSRQVIVVHAPDPALFDQAIFILKDDVVNKKSVTDDMLLKEAKRLIGVTAGSKRKRIFTAGLPWACAGALLTGAIWLISILL